MIRLLGQTHQTEDGRSYYIEACQVLPLDGEYDVMLFDISKTKSSFSMGIAFSKQLVGQLAAMGLDLSGSRSLMEHGLAQLREQLDVGVEEDGRVFESRLYGKPPIDTGGAIRRRYLA